MSDQRARIREMVADLAEKIKKETPQRKDDKIYQQALLDLKDSPRFEEVIANRSRFEFAPNRHVCSPRP
jgi:hypothetical protein